MLYELTSISKLHTFLKERAGTGDDLVVVRYSSQVKPSISGQSETDK